ncbi:hypothetical protein R1flu_005214 [Riccia fluitans]|uniref:Uncharacterized protein n=1 Tax=Riccia fluitans TaxID=41844 RepID=A0ABD1YSU2_9MARC
MMEAENAGGWNVDTCWKGTSQEGGGKLPLRFADVGSSERVRLTSESIKGARDKDKTPQKHHTRNGKENTRALKRLLQHGMKKRNARLKGRFNYSASKQRKLNSNGREAPRGINELA